MSDEEFENRLRGIKPMQPSPELGRRIADTLEVHRVRSSGTHNVWRVAAALLAGAILGYGVARFETQSKALAPPDTSSVRVIIVRENPEGPRLLDFSPAANEQPPLQPLTVKRSIKRPSDV